MSAGAEAGGALRVPALVLAGGGASPAFARAAGLPASAPFRALAEIHGVPMVRYVLHALRRAASIDRVLLVAPPVFPHVPEAHEIVPGGGDLAHNIRAGLERCGGASSVLLVSADLPFLTPEAVDDFVARCVEADADCCYAAIREADCTARFPAMRRTYLRTRGVAVTGGNVVFQRVAAFEREVQIVREAYRRRKNPLFLAQLIGYGNVLRFLMGALTLEEIERAASRVIGVRCRIVLTPYPELGADVDSPEHLRIARKLLQPL